MGLGSKFDGNSGELLPPASVNLRSSSPLLACLESSVPDPRWPSKHRWSASELKVANQSVTSSAHDSSSSSPAKSFPPTAVEKSLVSVQSTLPVDSIVQRDEPKLANSSPPTKGMKISTLADGVSADFVRCSSHVAVNKPPLVVPSLPVNDETEPVSSNQPPIVPVEIVAVASDRPNAPKDLVSPPLKGAWAKKLKYTSSSASGLVTIPVSSKEDDLRFPWAAKMDPAARNLYRATSPEYMEDGTPKVTIPSHVLLQGLENQKEYVLGQFYRCTPPPGGLIHAVVNRIWGRKCRIFMRKLEGSKFLFHIPDASTRAWVLQRGLWHVDDFLMFVAPWLAADTFDIPEISTIPVWVTLKNIPHRLYSIPGISHIASGLGAPMATYKPRLDPSLMGEAKILVEVELSKAFPPRIAAADKKGNISMVNVEYAWVPAICGDCGQLGHKDSRCMQPHVSNENGSKLASKDVITPTIVSISNTNDLVSPTTLQTESLVVPITTITEIQIDTALLVEAVPIQVTEQSPEVAEGHTNVEAEVVTEAICTVDIVTETAGTHDDALSDREVRHVMTNNRFNHLGSSFSDGESLDSDGESVESDDSENVARLMDQMTPAGQRILRERPVQLSLKAKEIQESSIARGRGYRGRGNRGRRNR
ncbi:PREDICTED: uncharacterized protein LOC104732389 [Camelina sativa]|uniref:Uncharacterized protein LOC104732389 n=1 Tax=Camelina sativa TaxID=90675 RepID=A0ABM0V3I9_CAMSA|nr:PREDICTED: uncharacterized protein LOC104732389 [Camelina sativa]